VHAGRGVFSGVSRVPTSARRSLRGRGGSCLCSGRAEWALSVLGTSKGARTAHGRTKGGLGEPCCVLRRGCAGFVYTARSRCALHAGEGLECGERSRSVQGMRDVVFLGHFVVSPSARRFSWQARLLPRRGPGSVRVGPSPLGGHTLRAGSTVGQRCAACSLLRIASWGAWCLGLLVLFGRRSAGKVPARQASESRGRSCRGKIGCTSDGVA
jgi:hypothetical protein